MCMTDRQTDRETETETETETHTHTHTHTDECPNKQSLKGITPKICMTDRQTDRETETETERHTHTHTHAHTHTHTHTHTQMNALINRVLLNLSCVWILPKMRSAFIPTVKHFCSRQEGQKRRVCTVMGHSPLNRHTLR